MAIHAGAAKRPTLPPEDQLKLGDLRTRLEKLKSDPGSTLEALYAAQELFSYVPPEAVTAIAEELELPESEVFGVLTFYTMFHRKPSAKYVVRVCRDLSCHLSGAPAVLTAFSEALGTRVGELTEDGLFETESVSCLGLCDLQPAVLVNLSL
jgi:NADH:ubiquinone oxidoreductase subunit E